MNSPNNILFNSTNIYEDSQNRLLVFGTETIPYQNVQKHIFPTLNESSFVNSSILGVHKIKPFHPNILGNTRIWFTLDDSTETVKEIEKQRGVIDNILVTRINTPRILLGRFTSYEWEYPCIFSPFIDQVNAFRNRLVPILRTGYFCFQLVDWTRGTIYELDTTLVLKVIDAYDSGIAPENHSILLALVYRLIVLHYLMDTSKRTEIVFQLQLFIDTHLDLLRHMVFYNRYTDEELLDPFSNPEELTISSFDCFYPRDDRFFCCTELFDITPCIDMGNAWNDIRPKGDNVLSALIHLLVCKNQNQKCQSRNFLKILKVYFLRFPVLIDVFRLILLVGLLGNYPHAKQRPKVLERMDIYMSFDQTKMTDSDFFSWIEQNESLTQYTAKEFYIYSVEATWSLDQIFASEETWESIKENVKSAMDMARALLRRKNLMLDVHKKFTTETFIEANTECFKNIQHELDIYDDDARTHLTKSFKKYFVETLNKILKKVKEDTIENQLITIPVISEEYLRGDTLQIIDTIVSDIQFTLDKRFETKWLILFGAKPQTIKTVQHLYFKFEKKNMNETMFGNTILELFRDDFYGFHALCVYVSKLLERSLIQYFELPLSVKENQIRAIRQRYKIMPWEEIDFEYDKFYYCTSCKNWISPHINPNRQNLEPVYSLGLGKCIYCWETKRIFCKRESNSLILKKLKNNPDLNRDELEEGNTPEERKMVKKTAKAIRQFKTKPVCRQTELSTTPMIGFIIKLNNKMWVICEICGIITPFDHLALSTNGLVCPLHTTDTEQRDVMPLRFRDKYKKVINKLKERQLTTEVEDSQNTHQMEQEIKTETDYPIQFIDQTQRKFVHLIESLPEQARNNFDESFLQTHTRQQDDELAHQKDLKTKQRELIEQTIDDLSLAVEENSFVDKDIVYCHYCNARLNVKNREKCFKQALVDKSQYKVVYLCEKHYMESEKYVEHTTVPRHDSFMNHIAKKEFFLNTHKKQLKQ